MTSTELEQAIMDALNKCTLPSPHKRGILNNIESRLRLEEQIAKNASKLEQLGQTRKATTK